MGRGDTMNGCDYERSSPTGAFLRFFFGALHWPAFATLIGRSARPVSTDFQSVSFIILKFPSHPGTGSTKMLSSACFIPPSASPVLRKSFFSAPICAQKAQIHRSPQKRTRMSSQKPEDRNDGRATSGLFGVRLRTNGDVIKFGIAAIAFCYAFKTGLQLLGTPDLLAGQLTTAFVSVLSLVVWVSTYVFRVGTKGMTYAQQLREYEDQVIQKRYEELTEDELRALTEELSDDA